MEFIKKNLWLVVGGAVGLALLLVACVYLFLHARQYRADTASADEQQSRLEQLKSRKPGPTEANVQIVASNRAVLEGYQQKVIETLRAGQIGPRIMQPIEFNSFLKATIEQMKEAASKRGLVLPPKFDFGFKTYYSEGRLPAADDVPRLTVQVQTLRALMAVLRLAKVAEVVAVERQIFEKGATPPAGAEEEGRRGAASGAAVAGGQEPPGARELYTREHFVLTLRIRDEFMAGLFNALGQGANDEQQRLFAVVTSVDLTGGGLPKAGPTAAESAPAAVEPPPGESATPTVGEPSTEPKKREERIVAGTENVTVRLDVDAYRFTGAAGEKAKP
jgi:hypothetical protein